jgi:thioredoxin-like negative regulator of GroEL
MLEQLNEDTFNEKVLDSTGKVAVLFHAPWAEPSVVMFLLMEQYPVYHVDVEENPEVGAIVNVKGLPLLMVFDHGTIESFKVGLMTESQIKVYLTQEEII